MKTNSTFINKLLVTVVALFIAIAAAAQTGPKLKFRHPVLVAGTDAAVGATYQFKDVSTGVDAFIRIEDINNGAYLVNIDDSIVGYYDAWQPTVGGPNVVGSSYIKWDIEFKTSAGDPFVFSVCDATAIDVDGDNSKISEFVGVNGQSAYGVPSLIPSLLTITALSDTDDVNHDDPSPTNLWAFGPITNRFDIDTSSQDVRINYHFTNMSKFKFYTGSTVRSPGGSVNRYHSIYFMDIASQNWSVLPVTFQNFYAALANKAVNLSWSANDGLQTSHFEIERSFDQVNFSTAALLLAGMSNDGNTNQYNYSDKDADMINHKTVYYRLKQVDMNGSFNYSAIKMVRIGEMTAQKTSIQVMPNPYMNELNINFESATDGKAEIRLVNASGITVKATSSDVRTGLNRVQLQDLANQRPGIYVMNIYLNGKPFSSNKIVKK